MENGGQRHCLPEGCIRLLRQPRCYGHAGDDRNGSCYKAKDFAKPYTPKTNGMAGRFIQTALREWAYARAYPSSEHSEAHLPNWSYIYNWHCRYGSLKSKTPISCLGLNRGNMLTLHTWSCFGNAKP